MPNYDDGTSLWGQQQQNQQPQQPNQQQNNQQQVQQQQVTSKLTLFNRPQQMILIVLVCFHSGITAATASTIATKSLTRLQR